MGRLRTFYQIFYQQRMRGRSQLVSGCELRQMREARGWTKQDLAERIGYKSKRRRGRARDHALGERSDEAPACVAVPRRAEAPRRRRPADALHDRRAAASRRGAARGTLGHVAEPAAG